MEDTDWHWWWAWRPVYCNDKAFPRWFVWLQRRRRYLGDDENGPMYSLGYEYRSRPA